MSTMQDTVANKPNGAENHQQLLDGILVQLRGLQFGSLEITVHDGRIVQVERREKQRLNLVFQDSAHDVQP